MSKINSYSIVNYSELPVTTRTRREGSKLIIEIHDSARIAGNVTVKDKPNA